MQHYLKKYVNKVISSAFLLTILEGISLSTIQASTTNVASISDDVSFERSLQTIRVALAKRTPNCFISYGWEDDLQHPNHVFVKRLCNDLKKAGVNAKIDVNDLVTGELIEDFTHKISQFDYFVITVLTPTFKQRAFQEEKWLHHEIRLIKARLNEGDSFFYVPLLVEGDMNSSIPDNLEPAKRLYKDFRLPISYNNSLLEILNEKLLHSQSGSRKRSDNLSSLFNKALDYEYGRGGVLKNAGEAEKIYLKLVEENDHSKSKYQLGMMYWDGREGVNKNTPEGLRLLLLSCDQRYVEAEYRLGLFYRDGNNVSKNTKLASDLLYRAAKQGYEYAIAIDTPIKRGLELPDIYRRYRESYLRLLSGILIYKPNPNSDEIEFRIADLANPLEETFDLSECGGAVRRNLSISTGHSKKENENKSSKVEVWICPKFLIEQNLNTTASHYQKIMSYWSNDIDIGIFINWTNGTSWYNFAITQEIMNDLNTLNLYQILERSPFCYYSGFLFWGKYHTIWPPHNFLYSTEFKIYGSKFFLHFPEALPT